MQNYITLAIHTYSFAADLKQLLEKNSIDVRLENVDPDCTRTACGVRVRIPREQLPQALTIVEHQNTISPSVVEMEFKDVNNKILIPVDFSESCMNACKIAFVFAGKLGLHPVILHVYATPYYDASLSSNDGFALDISDAEVRKNLEAAAKYEMKKFCQRLNEEMKSGNIPTLRYSTLLNEGMPEEAILNFTRQSPPDLVVMATRDADKRSRELMGSVTAEVLDNCRVSVLAWPVSAPFTSLPQLRKSIFFCNIDQNDLLAMDMYVRLFDSAPLDVTLVPVNEKAGSKLKGRLNALLEYFCRNYPQCTFSTFMVDVSSMREKLLPYVEQHDIKMLVVPNKKKNILARLFNPGLAHRVVFEADMPLLALPV